MKKVVIGRLEFYINKITNKTLIIYIRSKEDFKKYIDLSFSSN